MPDQIKKLVNNKARHYLIEVTASGKNVIFSDSEDYQFLLSLFRYLLPIRSREVLIGGAFVDHSDNIFPLAYSLCPRSIELLLRCSKAGCEKNFVDDLMSLYAAYFFDKYKRNLNESYKTTGVHVNDLLGISRTVHTKPSNWRTYEHSSIRAYMYDDGYEWLRRGFIKDLGYTTVEYLRYLEG